MLHWWLEKSARRDPDRVAVEDPVREHEITYGKLDEQSSNGRDELRHHGLRPGDRVAICAAKSSAALVSIFGVLKAGGAYVPIAADAPRSRIEEILADCGARMLLADAGVAERLGLEAVGPSNDADGLVLVRLQPQREQTVAGEGADALAYILYTSGSTGTPKGVMHSHRSAASFVGWCSETFEPTAIDRFSSHAPFCFDLSIFDIYVPIKHGARLVLIDEQLAKHPARLAALISGRKLSIWYSTPSILRLLAEYGRLEQHDVSPLRLVLFAGEVFPRRSLASLVKQWPTPRYFNLYGPTETNVCTFCEVHRDGIESGTGPQSIGRACAGTLTRIVGEGGREVCPGEPGELEVSGGTVMLGYWNRPELNVRAFVDDETGRRWYRTGDLAREAATGDYLFLGRRDRMVKRRGFRIELGEIESLLYRHPLVTEAAVVALADPEDDVRIQAFLRWAGEQPPSLIDLKRMCSESMPPQLIPDRFSVVDAIPKTSTDKVDYRALADGLGPAGVAVNDPRAAKD